MSIRIWNEKTKRWEVQTSLHATGIAVRDITGNFKNQPKTVESCLEETQITIANMKKDIKYIYENGTIGGGGSGGSAFPKIELQTPTEIIVKTENNFTISYFFNSPNPGDGVINYVITKKNSLDAPIIDLKKTIKQGRNSYTFDPLPSGEYELSISGIDSTGIGTNNIVCNIVCGALELTTNDELSKDVRLGENIVITYKINSIFKDDINVEIHKPDGSVIKEIKKPGTYTLELEPFESLGIKNLIIKANCKDVESNTLKYTFIVTDATNMFMSTTFEGGQFRSDENVTINYRISLLGTRKFLTDVYINGELHESDVSSKNGHNFYTLNNLAIGNYIVTFKSRTLESQNPIRAELTVPAFEIISSEFRNYSYSKDSLILSLDARRGKNNNQSEEKRSVWEDTEPTNPTRTKLYNFAFNFINGWVEKSEEEQIVEGLKFSGKSYAEIDLLPLAEKLKNGLTFEIRYKNLDLTTDTNGNYSCILDCFKNEKENGKGIMIDSKEAVARTSYADSIYNEYNDSEWVTQTFVIDYPNQNMLLYTNGAISSYSKIDKDSDMLVNKKIILGAKKTDSGNMIRNSNCMIQTIRIYNRVLDDLEIFKNYVSDLPLEKQDEMIAMQEGQLQIPTLKLKFDESMLGNASSTTNVDIEYSDPSDPSKNIILYNSVIQKQGTTSLTYPVSNYTIKLYDGGSPFDYAPKDNWVPENIFTLKADYMDSSHANNTGIASYASEVFKRLGIKNPAQQEDDRVKNTIDGFMVNLYINGTNRGLYNFNTDRFGAKNYGLSSTSFKTVSCSYEANSNTGNATGFHTQEFNKIKNAFKVRYFKGETDQNKYLTFDQELGEMVLTQGVHNEFINLIKWINEAGTESTKRFYSEFKEHLDLDHTLLYMLIVEIFGLMDNLEKNMVLTYFGEQYNTQTGMLDEVWFPQLYDLDSSVGLSNNGELKYQPCVNFTQEPGMPSDHQYNGTTSVLWSAVKKHFFTELKTYYSKMRRTGILNFETLINYYSGKTIEKVSPYHYSVDARLKYINPSASGNEKDTYYHFCKGRRIEFTKKWLKNRIQFLDSIYEYGNENNPDGDYWKYIQARYLKRNDEDTEFNIKVKSLSPIFLVVVDDSMRTDGRKYFVNNDKFYDIKVPINGSTDGAMFGITFGTRITELQFSDSIKLSSLYLEHAKSLYELNLQNNRDLKNIVLNNCENLRNFNVNGCIKLGSELGTEKINFINCPNIKNVDISNTSLSNFLVNEKGGVLETLKCNKSNIETFILGNQPYINELNILECNNLKKIELVNCSNIHSVELPTSRIETFRLLDCKNVTNINVSNTPLLDSLTDKADSQNRPNFLIDNCPSLTKIVMHGLNNKNMTFLDLINVENIKYIDISSCGYLSEIRFSEACNSLTTLLCSNSAITNFKFGRSGQTVNYLDFSKFDKINSVDFNNCFNVRAIINCNFGKTTPMNAWSTFRNCKNLENITGYLRMSGNGSYTFNNCAKLRSLPAQIDFSGITSTDNMFSNTKIDLNEAKRILKNMINVTSLDYTFTNCNIVTNNFPKDIFYNNLELTSISGTFGNNPGITGEFCNEIFKNNIKLKNITFPFYNCNLEMPIFNSDKIFSGLTELEYLRKPFHSIKISRMPNKNLLKDCSKLKSVFELFEDQKEMLNSLNSGDYFIEEDYFANNPLIENFEDCFYNCKNLIGKIPARLFFSQENIKTIETCFAGCSSLEGSIPENLIKVKLINGIKSGTLINANGAFNGCSNLTGNIPNDLFEYQRNLTNMVNIFNGCTNLGSGIEENQKTFPYRIFKNKPQLVNVIGCFRGCKNLKIDLNIHKEEFKELFSDNPELAYIDELFYECKNMHGELPAEIFSKQDSEGQFIPNKIYSANYTFYACTNLTGNIPRNIFKSFYKIESLKGFFQECNRFYGGIPYDLLINCTNLKSVDSLFNMGASNHLGEQRNHELDHCLDEKDGILYSINKDFFIGCPKLENVNKCFLRAGLKGNVPTELFRNNKELKFLNNTFWGTTMNLNLNREFFGRNPKITDLREAFTSGGTVTITEDFIRSDFHNYVHRDQNGKIIEKDFGATFANTKMTGIAPKLWEMFPNANTIGPYNNKTFTGTNVDNIDEIPLNWK